MIIWVTGNSGTGKTTIGQILAAKFGGVFLDGDRMRETVSLGAGFSKEDREEHNLRVARLAGELERQGFVVIVAVIAPFESTRKKIDKMICPLWIWLYQEGLVYRDDRPYEKPSNAICSLDTSKISIYDCILQIDSVLEDLVTSSCKFWM